jgi:hypothetical protein
VPNAPYQFFRSVSPIAVAIASGKFVAQLDGAHMPNNTIESANRY